MLSLLVIIIRMLVVILVTIMRMVVLVTMMVMVKMEIMMLLGEPLRVAFPSNRPSLFQGGSPWAANSLSLQTIRHRSQ